MDRLLRGPRPRPRGHARARSRLRAWERDDGNEQKGNGNEGRKTMRERRNGAGNGQSQQCSRPPRPPRPCCCHCHCRRGLWGSAAGRGHGPSGRRGIVRACRIGSYGPGVGVGGCSLVCGMRDGKGHTQRRAGTEQAGGREAGWTARALLWGWAGGSGRGSPAVRVAAGWPVSGHDLGGRAGGWVGGWVGCGSAVGGGGGGCS